MGVPEECSVLCARGGSMNRGWGDNWRGTIQIQRGVVLEQWRGGQGDTQERAHSISELNHRSVTQTEDRVENYLHKAACEHQWAYTYSQCWELATSWEADKR